MKGLGTNMPTWVCPNMGYSPNYRLYHRYMYICIGDMKFCTLGFCGFSVFFYSFQTTPHNIVSVTSHSSP